MNRRLPDVVCNTSAIVAFLCTTVYVKAQTMPVEMMAGNRNYYQQFSVSKESSVKRLGFFNTSSLLFLYCRAKQSELMSQSYATYSVSGFMKLGFGCFYASGPGMSPSFNMQFTRKGKSSFFIASPRIDLKVNPTFDLMTSVELRPAFNDSIRWYFRLQTMFNYSVMQHNRSYQYVRVGIAHKKRQMGLAVNRDSYGREYTTFLNYGLFYRVELN